jgi:hypothetical protein
MDAQSWISCVVAPQWMYLACSGEIISVICSTRGSTGYPTISVSMASFSKLFTVCQQPLIDSSMLWMKSYLIFPTLQPSVMAAAVSSGTIPASACALANAVSTSIIRETYCSSEKSCRASSVPNRLRKIRESMAAAFMVIAGRVKTNRWLQVDR